jgi:hypothetical protein
MSAKKKITKKGKLRKRITSIFAPEQIAAIDSLIGPLGADYSNVVSYIVVSWLYKENRLININKSG